MSSPLNSRVSPLLPWEVVERIIGHSDSKVIANFALTCRELRPRSLCLLVADVTLHNRDKLFDFCDFLKAKPHLQPLVHSILVVPDNLAPIPLLRMLPNLSELKFMVSPSSSGTPSSSMLAVFNQSTLTNCQLLSARIQSLCLSDLDFKTSIQFLRVLSAFMSIKHLVCSNVYIGAKGGLPALDMAKRRLSQRLRLLTLAITYRRRFHRDYYYDQPSVSSLLLDSGLVQSTVERLTVEGVYKSTGFPQQFDWPRLRSLALKLWCSSSEDITSSILFLKDFHDVTLKEVAIEVHERAILPVSENPQCHTGLYEELEHILLGFSKVHLVWVLDVYPIGRNSFRVQEIETRFPVLLQRGVLTVVPNTALRTGHTHIVQTLVISSDSKWVASGSWDDTIALWDTADGAMVQRWLPYNNNPVISLAFSPNGQFLISATLDCSRLVIRDLRGDRHQVLEGHTDNATGCAWSPVGDVIASGSQDATARLWDANTFEPLHVLKHPGNSSIDLLKFSPDGHWLLTGCRPSSYHIWDVASGVGRRLCMHTIPTTLEARKIPVAAAFNSSSTCLAIASPIGKVEIIIPETGGEWGDAVLAMECGTGTPGWETAHLEFSPDGSMVLAVPSDNSPAPAMKIWDAYRGVELLSLGGYGEEVRTSCFSPCGKYIASASNTVRLWRISDGSCVSTLSDHDSQVSHVVFSPDGKMLVSGADNGSVIIRRMYDVLPIDERDL